MVKLTQRYFTEGTWHFDLIGKNIWKIFRAVSPHGIAMTGADVTTQLHIPFPHRFMRIHLYHTTSAYAVSIDALSVTLERPIATIPTLSRFTDQLYREYDISASKVIEVFGETFEYEEGIWSLVLNSTSTDIIFPVIYVQQLGGS